MNPKPLILAAAVFSAAGLAFAQERVQRSDLPSAVQQKLTSAAGQGAVIQQITRQQQDGRTVYEVQIDKQGRTERMTIAESGEVLKRPGVDLQKQSGTTGSSSSTSSTASRPSDSSMSSSGTSASSQNQASTSSAMDRASSPSSGSQTSVSSTSSTPSTTSSGQSTTTRSSMTASTSSQPSTSSSSTSTKSKEGDTVVITAGGDSSRTTTVQGSTGTAASMSSSQERTTSSSGETASSRRSSTGGDRDRTAAQASATDPVVGVAIVEYQTLRPIDTESMIPMAQLPAAVQQAIEREAPGREIADIDREMHNGRVVYEVEFRDSNLNPQLHFTEDGKLVEGTGPVDEAVNEVRNFFAGTQVRDTPQAVQEAIRREAATGTVTDIDIERRTGERVYEVEIEDSLGQYEIHLAEDGRVIRNERAVAE